ncbi:hypothetical protein BH09MYX1_BH09MYX1_23730 [soil metagenome]
MTAADAARAARKLDPKRIFAIHNDGWSHFRDDRENIGPAFERVGLGERLHPWTRGETVRWEG